MSARWAAIVGTGSAGRSRAAHELVTRLRGLGLTVAGALQERHESAGEHDGWDAVDLASGRRLPLARRSAQPELCEWHFDEASFAARHQAMLAADADVIVLELGELEARKRGNWPTLSALLARADSQCVVVACLRPPSLAAIALELPDPIGALELPGEGEDFEALVRAIVGARGRTSD